MSPEFSAL